MKLRTIICILIATLLAACATKKTSTKTSDNLDRETNNQAIQVSGPPPTQLNPMSSINRATINAAKMISPVTH